MGLFTKVSAVPALSLAAYEVGDVVGALLTFAGAASAYAQEGVLKRLTLIDAAQQDEALTLYLFNASPSAGARTDAALFAPTAADLLLMIGAISIAAADYVVGDSADVVLKELDFPFIIPATSLYGVLVAVATPDYTAADDLTVSLIVARR